MFSSAGAGLAAFATSLSSAGLVFEPCEPTQPYDPDLTVEQASSKKRKEKPAPVSRKNFIEICHQLTLEDEKAFKELWQRAALSVDWNEQYARIDNNYVEGFSGTGGDGISVTANNARLHNNYFYNNMENVTGTPYVAKNSTDLGASALTNPGSEDFSVGVTLQALAWPDQWLGASQTNYLDVGAVQREESGGGLLRHPGMTGGMGN